jgi:nucleotide-binding universal stress UspA family protein
MAFRTILVPTDFSEQSRAGLRLARDMVREQGSGRIIVLHVVVDALPALLPDVAGFRYDEIADELGRRAAEQLPLFFAPEERRDVEVEFRVAFGVPHAEICRTASELPADLVVIATHGRSAALHLLLGSVTDKVVRRACCPVLVARS